MPLPSAKLRAAHLVALTAFGSAQPAFELMKKNPDYFVAQGFSATDVIVYGFSVVIVPVAILMAVEFAAGLVHPRASRVVHQAAVGLLAFLLFGRALHTIAPALTAAILAALASIAFGWIYRTWQPARLLLTVSAFTSVLFVGLFFVDAPLAKLSATNVDVSRAVHVRSRTPVVLVIFDEFALSSLMTEGGRIDAGRYPNFAALERSATWYRSATTVHDYTSWAVPAILTGRRSRHEQLPLLADHPENLFTLLGPSYRIHAFESVTRMCPARLCPTAGEPLGARVRKLASWVRTSLLAARPLTSYGRWNNPPALVSGFVATLRLTNGRQLYVLHVLLPHSPWRYLPSGRTYDSGPPREGPVHDTWGDNRRLVDHGFEHHLLQVGYVDRVLGRIVHRLRATGLWNRSLFIVVADHGVSFEPGGRERAANLGNIADIAPVPLFVKTPGQRAGRIDDRSAKTIDIVPTIADVLRIRLPWQVDGHSLLPKDRPYPSQIVLETSTGGLVEAPWSRVKAGLYGTIARKTRLLRR